MALVSTPHSAYSPRLPWLGCIAGLLVGGAILYFWPQWNRTWLSLVPAPVSVYTRFLGVTLADVPLITYGHQALLGFLMVLVAGLVAALRYLLGEERCRAWRGDMALFNGVVTLCVTGFLLYNMASAYPRIVAALH
ncbi:TPA: hypothetical protein NPP58_001596 [Klebsiella quasipneumoniae subsp. quasipneumoniae]|nr:hypothetical protein [Klebsiella quasipneumoniae subsp. quasipneumoniae]